MLYSITGSDGKEYGPVDEAQLKKWFSEGRVIPDTLVKDYITGQISLLSDLPAFQTSPEPPVQDSFAYPLSGSDATAKDSIIPLAYSIFQSSVNLLLFFRIPSWAWVFTVFAILDLLRAIRLMRRGNKWGIWAVMVSGIVLGMMIVGFVQRG